MSPVGQEIISSPFSKLYKRLSPDNRNKDLRIESQKYLDQYLENRLSPQMWQGMNPSYRLDNTMDVTEVNSTYRGRREEPCDKVYFRRRDEIGNYQEATFKVRELKLAQDKLEAEQKTKKAEKTAK